MVDLCRRWIWGKKQLLLTEQSHGRNLMCYESLLVIIIIPGGKQGQG